MLHGVAHIRISTSPCAVDSDFYAVFIGGKVLPIKFKTWISAFRRFQCETEHV